MVPVPWGDTPCPKCGNRCHLMAGINLRSDLKDMRVLVCWPCKMARKVMFNSSWESIAQKQLSGVVNGKRGARLGRHRRG